MLDITKNTGVYQITCIVTGKIYIGSSIHIRFRISKHLSDLRNYKHHNKYLQRSWNKYGESNLKFDVLEECNYKNQLEREQFWIDKKRPYSRKIGFNLKKDVTDPVNNVKNYIVTFPNGEEIIVRNMHKFCRDYNLDRGSVCKVLSGKWSHHKNYKFRYPYQTNEQWENLVLNNKKDGGGWKYGWIIMFSDDTELFINSLKEYCKKNNYSDSSLRSCAYGKRKLYKNISCRRSNMAKKDWLNLFDNPCIIESIKINSNKNQQWIIETPQGIEIEISNLSEFCRNNNLSMRMMCKIKNDKNKSHRGYKCRSLVKNNELCTV